MNRHFVEMLSGLSAAGVEFLVIGAHAVAAHGYLRGTRDLDVWIRPTPGNAQRVWRALMNFGAPLREVTLHDLSTPGTKIGTDPNRIDILTAPTGIDFDDCWANRAIVKVNGQPFPFLGKADLIRSKRATGRRQDLLDLDHLDPA